MPLSTSISDAFLAASRRKVLPTALDTAGIREQLDVGLRARSVFVAHGTNTLYLDTVKTLIDRLAAGELSEGQVRTALWETLKAIGYTPEGGFPDMPPGRVPPALAGTLQDLSSFRRRDLIVQTQLALMRGAGQQMRGQQPDRLEAFPAWELVRISPRAVPRDWIARWLAVGGKLSDGRMIAAKGDPIWGELGSSDNFKDALDVDHPPFAFGSGMGWDERSLPDWKAAGLTDDEAKLMDELLADRVHRPQTIRGPLPLPSPKLSMADVDPALVKAFKAETKATSDPKTPGMVDFSDLLDEADAQRAAARKQGGAS